MSALAQPPAASVGLAGKYLIVGLAAESFGVAVTSVREIIRLQPITQIPQLPNHLKGVINLRGRVVPIIDLRLKFGLATIDTDRTCIVVVQVRRDADRDLAVGLIVDQVEEVVNLAGDDITPPPDFGQAVQTECLLGMARVRGQVKMLLDVEQAIGRQDLVRLPHVL